MQSENEPVAWRTFDGEGGYDFRDYDMNENYRDEYIRRNGTKYASWVEPLYTTPPQRKPLTDEQIEMLQFLDGSRPLDGVWFGEEHPKQRGEYWWRKHLHRAFDEAAHGIKENT